MSTKNLSEDEHIKLVSKMHGTIRAKPTNTQRTKNIFYGILTAAVPVFLYSTIFEMHPQHFGILYLALTLVAAAVLSFSYQNVAFTQWLSLTQKFQSRFSKGKKAGGSLLDKQMAGSSLLAEQAAAWSYLYSNVLFLFFVVLLGFFFFGNHQGPYNYALTMILSSGIVLFISGGAIR